MHNVTATPMMRLVRFVLLCLLAGFVVGAVGVWWFS